MAPVQTELQVEIRNGADVLSLVNSEATWRDLIIDLVAREKLDPWNIDVIEIVDKYVDTVKKLKVVDLRVPANIILAAAILIRLKSTYLSMPEYEDAGEAAVDPDVIRPNIAVDPLNLRLRIPPKRKISLNELIAALDEAITIKDTRTTILPRIPVSMPISIENFDIEAETEKLYDVIGRNVDRSNMMTFTHLSSISENSDILLGLFIPLLFLAHKEKISLIQEKFFSEIIIAMK
ncbi:MAG: segregation/condensation protein A [Candidatus Micrarchaeota archaeon]|nr:segregation/condensation protein A [Candidatus Micrarchaeota archaeon]MDE1834616.1 segregation/condensation protein A [Candidatus Micrarchaeota archaeon]MDE1859565.1 segregation/condensation protein A [Candidatus Micrarchaeota archaeon]